MPLDHDGVDVYRRVHRLEHAVIEHPAYCRAFGDLQETLLRGAMRHRDLALKARARLLYGASGAGKTTLLEQFAAAYPDTQTEDGRIRRVVTIEVPEAPTRRALVSAILGALGYTPGRRESANAIIADISEKVAQIGIELIVLDEAHHIVLWRDVSLISEFLKSLLNRVGCPIVLAGLPALRTLHGFEQLDRRLLPDVQLEAYDWTTVEGRLEFMVILKKFEALMALPEASDLSREETAMRIYVATGGHIGIVSKYLARALQICLVRGSKKIDLPLLAETFASWRPQQVKPTRIDFAAPLEIGERISPEHLLKRLSSVKINAASNPFACDLKQCAEIWETGALEPTLWNEGGAGRPRGRGRGRGPIEAFA